MQRSIGSTADLGFTLFELLIVLVLIGLLYFMTVPLFQKGLGANELRGAARTVAAGLRHARNEAVVKRIETTMQVDVAQRKFQISTDSREIKLPEKLELKLYTATQELVNEQIGAIRFYPDGGSTGGRVTVASEQRKYEVDVDWLTGRVSIGD